MGLSRQIAPSGEGHTDAKVRHGQSTEAPGTLEARITPQNLALDPVRLTHARPFHVPQRDTLAEARRVAWEE